MFHSNPLFPTFNHLPCQASIKIIAFFAEGSGAKIPALIMPRYPIGIIFSPLVFLSPLPINAQPIAPTPDDTIRVTVMVNADGSRTSYQYDNAKHEAIATTADDKSKPQGKVVYKIDDAGRFLSGSFFGPDDKFMFKTLYKY